jgi:hypothetical protein
MQCKCKEQALLKEQKHMKVQFFGWKTWLIKR